MIELSDADILARLTNTEDSTVERKTASDYRDCLKTAVAFSNSLPVDDPGIIFVGVSNDGTVQQNGNLDSLQRKVSEELSKVYPPIYPQIKVMMRDGKEFLAVIVRGSANRPHFAGQSYIRDGMQTVSASKEQFERVIAERTSKVRKLLEWRGKEITVTLPVKSMVITATVSKIVETTERFAAVLSGCSQFYVSAEVREGLPGLKSWPVEAVFIGFDNEHKRLELIVADELSIKRVKY